MGTKVKLTFDISNFEAISENSEKKLVGGFSSSLTGGSDSLETLSNNCHGGNCATGCGTNETHGCSTNASCNAVAGCGWL